MEPKPLEQVVVELATGLDVAGRHDEAARVREIFGNDGQGGLAKVVGYVLGQSGIDLSTLSIPVKLENIKIGDAEGSADLKFRLDTLGDKIGAGILFGAVVLALIRD
jgi:hypothetical protein